MDSLEAIARRQALAIINNQAALEAFRDAVTAMFNTMESRMAARMDAFMSNALRVERRAP